jgi:hypothetical protein
MPWQMPRSRCQIEVRRTASCFSKCWSNRFGCSPGRQNRDWSDHTMNFTAIDPRGTEVHISCTGGANFVAGALEPLLVRLAPGETYELLLPLDKFFCVLEARRKESHAWNSAPKRLFSTGCSCRECLKCQVEQVCCGLAGFCSYLDWVRKVFQPSVAFPVTCESSNLVPSVQFPISSRYVGLSKLASRSERSRVTAGVKWI